MLGFEDAQGQRLGSVGGKHGNGGLRHDWAFIHLGPDEMYGAAADFAPRRNDAFVRV